MTKPIFDRIQKKRVRVDPETLSQLEGRQAAIDYKGVAKKLLDANKGKGQDDLHYRAYMRAVVDGQPTGHLVKKHKGSEKARQALIDEAGKAPKKAYSYDRTAGFLQYKVNGQNVTNLEPEEAAKLRGLVRGVVGGKASVRLWTRGSTKGFTDINVYEGSQADYLAVLKLIERLGYVTNVARQEHKRRIEQFNWDFPPSGLTVFKPASKTASLRAEPVKDRISGMWAVEVGGDVVTDYDFRTEDHAEKFIKRYVNRMIDDGLGVQEIRRAIYKL